MSKYQTHEDKDYFEMELKSKDSYLEYRNHDATLCPKCNGYGGWILERNAYRNGHHFKASCNQCNGWGWIEKGSVDETCIHDWEERSQVWCKENNIKHYGTCWHVYQCPKCTKVRAVDSSG